MAFARVCPGGKLVSRRFGIWAHAFLVCGVSFAEQPSEFFETRVRPVLANNCLGCHGGSKMGGLQLDSREHLLKGGQTGSAVVPGDPEKSLLIQAVQRSHSRI